MLLRDTLVVGKSIELVHQPLGVHPAECVPTDGELTGVIADNHPLPQKEGRASVVS